MYNSKSTHLYFNLKIWHHFIINTEASVLEQHVTVVANGGGTSLTNFIHSQLVQSSGSQPGGQAPPKWSQDKSEES